MKRAILLLFLSCFALASWSQNPYMIQLNNAKAGCEAEGLVNINGTVFFVANDGIHGRELWKTDGTTEGTMLVKDINHGSFDAFQQGAVYMIAFRGQLYFAADDGYAGYELWKSDGTESGTMLVSEINTGMGNGIFPDNRYENPYFTAASNILYFRATDGGEYGIELWRSDGTTDGTYMVKDICPGDSNPQYIVNIGGVVYFSAFDILGGTNLWRSDGTVKGTSCVADIVKYKNIEPANLCVVGNTLYFTANDATNGEELWKSNGVKEGTVMVKDIRAGRLSSNIRNLINLNGTLVFSANDGLTGNELWKSDGSTVGTVQIKDIYTGNYEGIPLSNYNKFSSYNNKIYFQANNGTHGIELWYTDGSNAGTKMLKDIYSGQTSSFPTNISLVNGYIYFAACDGTNGNELWRSDGTEAGTVLFKDLWSGFKSSAPSNIFAVSGGFVFAANSDNGVQIWKSDGSATNTVVAKVIYTATQNSSSIGKTSKFYLTNYKGSIYFNCNDNIHGSELWKTNGTQDGTAIVKDIWKTNYSSEPNNSITIGNKVIYEYIKINSTFYFVATDEIHGTELWKSDGTEAGTVIVKDIAWGTASSMPSNIVNLNGILYFAADDMNNGRELWKSDGTDFGTIMIKDINPGGSFTFNNSSNPTYLMVLNNTLFFAATTSGFGMELWKSDGTTDGTLQVKDIRSGAGSSSPNHLINYNGKLFFDADDGVHGIEPFVSDGTSVGTFMLKDIFQDKAGSLPTEYVVCNSILYFRATNEVNGSEIWRTNGTPEGTTLLKDLAPESSTSNPYLLTDVNGTLYFMATVELVTSLWKSDGTDVGTVKVKDLTGASNFTVVNNQLYFVCYDANIGTEIWKTGGTDETTTPVTDINPAAESSTPDNLTFINGALFFSASDATSGKQLWTYIIDKPAIFSSSATNVTTTTANLNCNFSGYLTKVTFEIGLTTAYGTVIKTSPEMFSYSDYTSVGVPVTGLKSNTLYHFRVIAENLIGKTTTADYTFTTLPATFAINAPQYLCANATFNLQLTGSETGVSYQLSKNIDPDGTPLQGTGSNLIWQNKTPDTYMITATCTATGLKNYMGPATTSPIAIPHTPTITIAGTRLTSSASNGNQWYGPSGLIVGATAQTYTATAEGDYYVYVTLECKSDRSNIVTYKPDNGTGFEENQASQLTIYPNPSDGNFTFNFADRATDLSIIISDVNGKVVYKNSFPKKTNFSVDLTKFGKGVYFAKINSDGVLINRKLVVE